MNTSGARKLKEQIINNKRCSGCGACIASCAYFQSIGERIALVADCGREDGVCYQSCPRTLTDLTRLDQEFFGEQRKDIVLGHHSQLLAARAADRKLTETAQYGGTVSALVTYALQAQGFQAAILSRQDKSEPFIAASSEEVRQAGGSRYSAVPTLGGLTVVKKQGLRNVIFAGRPCQVTALRKMQSLAAEGSSSWQPPVGLIIGLFCFWALDTEFYSWLEGRLDGAALQRIDIPQGFLQVETDRGMMKIDLEEVRPMIRPACLDCWDNSSELADIAVGALEEDPSWNTLLVRSERGRQLLDDALQAGVLEVKPYPLTAERQLRNALTKRKTGLLAESESLHYLKIPESWRQALQGGKDINVGNQ